MLLTRLFSTLDPIIIEHVIFKYNLENCIIIWNQICVGIQRVVVVINKFWIQEAHLLRFSVLSIPLQAQFEFKSVWYYGRDLRINLLDFSRNVGVGLFDLLTVTVQGQFFRWSMTTADPFKCCFLVSACTVSKPPWHLKRSSEVMNCPKMTLKGYHK